MSTAIAVAPPVFDEEKVEKDEVCEGEECRIPRVPRCEPRADVGEPLSERL
jgi:hypothetical protein